MSHQSILQPGVLLELLEQSIVSQRKDEAFNLSDALYLQVLSWRELDRSLGLSAGLRQACVSDSRFQINQCFVDPSCCLDDPFDVCDILKITESSIRWRRSSERLDALLVVRRCLVFARPGKVLQCSNGPLRKLSFDSSGLRLFSGVVNATENQLHSLTETVPCSIGELSKQPLQQPVHITAICTYKSAPQSFSSEFGKGQWFNVVLADSSAEIQGYIAGNHWTSFNDQLKAGCAYRIHVRSENVRQVKRSHFNRTENNFELPLRRLVLNPTGSRIESIEDGTPDADIDLETLVETQLRNVQPIADVSKLRAESTVDVLAICHDSGQSFPALRNAYPYEETTKRHVTLVDDSGAAILCTVWGEDASQLPWETDLHKRCMLIRRAIVKARLGLSLSVSRD